MRKNLILSICFCLVSCSSSSAQEEISDGDKTSYYWNPVIDYSLPDPTIIEGGDGYYYLYATEDIRNLPIHRSKDLINWEWVGTAFTDRTRPDFEPGGGLWAPDINKIGDTYVLYYSMSKWGGEWTCGIGCATADKLSGPFKDHGLMFRSNEINVQNSIDPFYIEDAGKKFLFWGSFRGIYGIELSEDGLSIKQGKKPRQVAGTAYEGPYVDKNGRTMMDNQHEVLIHKNSSFVGTGHNSEIVTDKVGNDWVFYHAVATKHPEGRVLMMDKISWKDGWPVVATDSPSLKSEKPVL